MYILSSILEGLTALGKNNRQWFLNCLQGSPMAHSGFVGFLTFARKRGWKLRENFGAFGFENSNSRAFKKNILHKESYKVSFLQPCCHSQPRLSSTLLWNVAHRFDSCKGVSPPVTIDKCHLFKMYGLFIKSFYCEKMWFSDYQLCSRRYNGLYRMLRHSRLHSYTFV